MTLDISTFGKALSDPTRVAMLAYLREAGAMSCRDLSGRFKLSQPTFSYHVKMLRDAGLIEVTKEGTSHVYTFYKRAWKDLGVNVDNFLNNIKI